MSHIIECPVCDGDIEAGTDDNYNAQGTEIQCPKCRTWFYMTMFENALEDRAA